MAWAANVFELSMRGALPDGEEWVNTVGLRTDPGAVSTTLTSSLDAYFAAVDDVMNVAWSVTEAKLKQLSSNLQEVLPIVTQTGDDATGALPNQLALVCSFRTALATRAGRGRIYIAGVGLGMLDSDGQAATTPLTTLADALEDLYILNLPSNNWNPVVLHRNSETTTDITSIVVDSKFDTQRSRSKSVSPDLVITRP